MGWWSLAGGSLSPGAGFEVKASHRFLSALSPSCAGLVCELPALLLPSCLPPDDSSPSPWALTSLEPKAQVVLMTVVCRSHREATNARSLSLPTHCSSWFFAVVMMQLWEGGVYLVVCPEYRPSLRGVRARAQAGVMGDVLTGLFIIVC